MRNEVHLVTAQNGHVLSIDCWCEPSHIEWVTNKLGIKMLVIEHDDETLKHHILVNAERERDRRKPCLDFHTDLDWITRALTPPWTPPLLPPHDPNERNL